MNNLLSMLKELKKIHQIDFCFDYVIYISMYELVKKQLLFARGISKNMLSCKEEISFLPITGRWSLQ